MKIRTLTTLTLLLPLVACNRPGESQESQTAQGLAEAVLEVSLEDPDPVPRLLDLCLGGREARAFAADLGAQGLLELEDLALLELVMHEPSVAQWERLLSRKAREAEARRRMGFSDRHIPHQTAPRPRELERLWSTERLRRSIQDLESHDPGVVSQAVREIQVFRLIGRFPAALEAQVRSALLVSLHSEKVGIQESGLLLVRRCSLRGKLLTKALLGLASEARPDVRPDNRGRALLALGLQDGVLPKLIPLLREAVLSKDSSLRQASLEVLAEHANRIAPDEGDRLTPSALGSLASDQEAEILAALDFASHVPFGEDHATAFARVCQRLLSHSSAEVRSRLPDLILHRLPQSREAASLLIPLARDASEEVRLEANLALNRLPLDSEIIQKALHTGDPLSRLWMLDRYRVLDSLPSGMESRLLRWIQETGDQDPSPTYLTALGWLPNWSPATLALVKQQARQTVPTAGTPELLFSTLVEAAHRALARTGRLDPDYILSLEGRIPAMTDRDRELASYLLFLNNRAIGKAQQAAGYVDALLGSREYAQATIRAALSLALPETTCKTMVRQLLQEFTTQPLPQMPWKDYAKLGRSWRDRLPQLEKLRKRHASQASRHQAGWYRSQRIAEGLGLLIQAARS